MYRPKEGYNYYVSHSIVRLRVAEVDFVYDIKKDDFFQRAGGHHQSIQMAFWPPTLPEPTSVRKFAELTSFRVFTKERRKSPNQ